MTKTLAVAAAAEFTGTALLLAVIVGSGIMGERLAGGNMALALLANSFATGCGLFVLIVIFASVSGSHFNPLVSILARFEGTLGNRALAVYIAMQLSGAVAGVALAHGMFDLEAFAPGLKERTGLGQSLAEGVATFGLVLAILGARRYGTVTVAAVVAAYIACAYWFTASTSFANPAVTVARSLTPTFAGIAPQGVVAFVLAQTIGAALSAIFGIWLLERTHSAKQDNPDAD